MKWLKSFGGLAIQCNHLIEARRPDIAEVERENSKVLITDRASHGDTRVRMKEIYKVAKYLKRGIKNLWMAQKVLVIPIAVGFSDSLMLGMDYCRKQFCWGQ